MARKFKDCSPIYAFEHIARRIRSDQRAVAHNEYVACTQFADMSARVEKNAIVIAAIQSILSGKHRIDVSTIHLRA